MLDYPFPHIEKVYSSAGAGKTHELSLRYVLFLLSPRIEKSDFRNMLAVTFSNPAASEMKSRILDWLKRAALDLPMRNGKERVRAIFKEKLGMDEKRIAELAREKIDEILENYPYFYVKTIDSFMNTVIKATALDMGMPPSFDIIKNGKPYIEYVIDLIVASTGSLVEESPLSSKLIEFLDLSLSLDVLSGWSPSRSLKGKIRSFIEKETQTGKEFYDVGLEKLEVLEEEVLRRIDTIIDKLEKKKIDGELIEKFKDLKRFVNEKIVEKDTLKDFYKILERSLIDDLFLRAEINSFLEEIFPEYVYVLARTKLSPYAGFYNAFKEELDRFKRDRRLVFIEELGLIVNRYIKKGIVPEIYFRLGEEIRHFLIDEFQDTSELQWENLKPLVEEALSRGGSLFVVGDVKQAIYGWRGGRAEIFEKIKEELPLVGDRLFEKKQDKNYRSYKNILKFVEDFFKRERLVQILGTFEVPEENVEKLKYDVKQEAVKGEGGYVRVEFLKKDDSRDPLEISGERIVKLLREDILQRYLPGDVAILLRKKEEIQKLTEILTRERFRVQSDVTLNIKSDPIIREIISLVKFLDSPIDNLSFASFILGEVFLGASGLERNKMQSLIEDWVLKYRDKKPLYRHFRESYPKEWSRYFERLFRSVGFLPPYDLVDLALRTYRIRERFPEREALYTHVLEIIHILEGRGLNNVKDFLKRWEEADVDDEEFLIPTPETATALKMMTMHKAKGLEFKVVIIPLFYLIPRLVRVGDMGILIVEEEERLIPHMVSKRFSENSIDVELIRRHELIKNLKEELNLAYVSITRAEEELYILVPEKISNQNNLYYNMLNSGAPIMEVGERLEKAVPIYSVEETFLSDTKEGEWFTLLVDEGVKRGIESLKRREAILRGSVIHSVLREIKTERDMEALESLIESELKTRRLNLDVKEIASLIKRTFEFPVVKKTLKENVMTEFEVVSGRGEHFIIDRILFDEDRITILEFKTGEEYSDEHIAQVRNYIGLVKDIHPEKKIEAYLVYMDEGKVLEVQWER